MVSATDSDIGNNGLVSYSILSVLSNGVPVNVENSPFGIDSLSGAVLVSGELDREGVASYSLQLQAADSGNPPRQTQALVSPACAFHSFYFVCSVHLRVSIVT